MAKVRVRSCPQSSGNIIAMHSSSLSLSRIAHSMCTLRPSPSLARPPIAASRSAGQPKYDCSYYRQFCGRSPQWLKRLYLCHAPMDRPKDGAAARGSCKLSRHKDTEDRGASDDEDEGREIRPRTEKHEEKGNAKSKTCLTSILINNQTQGEGLSRLNK